MSNCLINDELSKFKDIAKHHLFARGMRLLSEDKMEIEKQKEVSDMDEITMLDNIFNIIMKRMVESGQAPHYTEIATELGISMEEGRKAVRNLFSPQFLGWLFPDTDYIVTFPPFSNLPTQYRITVDGQQKWFAQ